jgi:subtilisin family serine protease
LRSPGNCCRTAKVRVAAAAGNQNAVGSSPIVRHPWVIPVAGCDATGNPSPLSNFGASIGRNGLLAPAEKILTLAADGGVTVFEGTSAATPFVSGAAALLWSEFPSVPAAALRAALLGTQRRRGIVPPLLDAAFAARLLAATNRRNA